MQKREKYINFLNYTYPDVQCTPTDFMANGKTVQEKVAGLLKNRGENALCVYLSSNNGKENRVRKFRTYRLGENDYYWIHSSIDERFWIIPEIVLYNKGYISASDETKKNKRLPIGKIDDWLKEFEYAYDHVEESKDRINALFS